MLSLKKMTHYIIFLLNNMNKLCVELILNIHFYCNDDILLITSKFFFELKTSFIKLKIKNYIYRSKSRLWFFEYNNLLKNKSIFNNILHQILYVGKIKNFKECISLGYQFEINILQFIQILYNQKFESVKFLITYYQNKLNFFQIYKILKYLIKNNNFEMLKWISINIKYFDIYINNINYFYDDYAENLYNLIYYHKNINIFIWLITKNLKITSHTYQMIISNNYINILQWMFNNNYHIPTSICNIAVKFNKIDIINFVLKNKIQFKDNICDFAIIYDKYDILVRFYKLGFYINPIFISKHYFCPNYLIQRWIIDNHYQNIITYELHQDSEDSEDF